MIVVAADQLHQREPLDAPLTDLPGVGALAPSNCSNVSACAPLAISYFICRAQLMKTSPISGNIASVVAGKGANGAGRDRRNGNALAQRREIRRQCRTQRRRHARAGRRLVQSSARHPAAFRYGQRVSFSGETEVVPRSLADRQPRALQLSRLGGEAANLSVVPVYSLTEDLRPGTPPVTYWQSAGSVRGARRRNPARTLAPPTQLFSSGPGGTAKIPLPAFSRCGSSGRRRVHLYEEFLVLQLALAARPA